MIFVYLVILVIWKVVPCVHYMYYLRWFSYFFFTKRWYLKTHANIWYVRRDCAMLQYRVLWMLPRKYRFNLFDTPKNFVISLAIISMCDFYDMFSFKFNPRKLNLPTLSIGILSICTGVAEPSISLLMAWKTMYSGFFIFRENLFTVNQLYTPLNSSLMSVSDVTGAWILL